MRKFIILLPIFLFLSFNLHTVNASPAPSTFTQGIYKVKDAGLLAGTGYSIQNTSPTSKSLVMIIDRDQTIQEFIRLGPSSPKYSLKPLNQDDLIIIIGASSIAFS